MVEGWGGRVFIAAATDKPQCFFGNGTVSLILMLHFSLFEVYIDVVHLDVYYRQSERI